MVRALITRLDHCVDAFETKEELTHGDCLAIQSLIKWLKTLDADVRQHHYTIVDLLDNQAVDEEQAALDNHNEKLPTSLINYSSLFRSQTKLFIRQALLILPNHYRNNWKRLRKDQDGERNDEIPASWTRGRSVLAQAAGGRRRSSEG